MPTYLVMVTGRRMPTMLPIATAVFCLLGLTQDQSVVSGVVRDESGQPLPGVTVTLSADQPVGRVVTGENGTYRLPGVPPGRYELRASLPGFLVDTRRVSVPDHDTTETITLRIGAFAEVLHTVPPPRDAVVQSDVIAHVRLGRRVAPLPCEGLAVVSTLFDADVVSVLKGAAPAAIQVYQDGAGECVAGATVLTGMAERPYLPGTELIVFLTGDGTRYHRVSGGALAFIVRQGIVETRAWSDLPPQVTVDAFRKTLLALAR